LDARETGEMLLAICDGGSSAKRVPISTLATAGLLERQHLQEWVIAHPQILGGAIKIVTSEYDVWAVGGDPQRDRLDILGLDVDGRLVVVELKRGVVGDTVEMQAIKYAAMTSRFTLSTLAAAHAAYWRRREPALSDDQALEALQAHAPGLTDETLADPRIIIVANGFDPVVISSVMWLATHGVNISLVRFQPYQQPSGQVLVTFSRLFPLPDLDKVTVGPRSLSTEVPTDTLPVTEWSVADLIGLGRVANATTRTILDLCSERPDSNLSLTEIVDAAGVSRAAARGQLAGLTMIVKRRFNRRNWPFVYAWGVDGSQQAFYSMAADVAERWREAVKQIDAEQSGLPTPGANTEVCAEGSQAAAFVPD
jgi:hypothetical protein